MITFQAHNTTIPNISQERSRKIVKDILMKRADLGFIDVDTTDISDISLYTQKVWYDFENIVILWIWGSALWTKALLEALRWKYYNENKIKNWKNIYVLDNIDTQTFTDVEEIINISKTLFIFISKSWGTIETLSEYLYFRDKCKAQNNTWQKQFCFIVWENYWMKQGLEKVFKVFYIPENIWGRFSVFTPVGLLPLAFAGVDISLFLEWISEIKDSLLHSDLENNIALILAHTQYKYYREWKNICVFFPYSSRMFQIGEWYKQLMWESIGKNSEGITLTSSLWVTDQHSQLQLYQDGPKDKLYLFLDVIDVKYDLTISADIPNFSFNKLLKIEKYGTMASLQNEGHPVCNISLESLDEKHIAQLLYILMFQIAYLWELFEINAFDQPGVEKSKIITKQKLKEEIWDVDVFSKAFYG
jgi:glucose-6-phosphate isomerase